MNGPFRLTAHAALATVAASLSLSAVFIDMRWLVPVAGGVAVVALVSDLVRRSPLPAALGPFVASAVTLCYLTVLYARADAPLGFVPGSAALSTLGNTARSGFDDIRRLSAPVPTHQGLVMLAVVGIAAVALVVDLIAVTMRRAAAAGMPLLAVFAVCTSVARHGVGWIAFGLGTAGYLSLLLADSRERISRWGRTLGVAPGTRVTWSDQGVAPSPLSALGRRIGLTAIVIGVVLPMLVPGLHGGLPKSGPGGSGGNHGGNNVETVNPIVTLHAQLTSRTATPLLSYVSTDPQPPYLRLTSLSEFDGDTFSPKTLVATTRDRVSRGINAPATTGSSVTTTVHIGRLAVHWLPLPTQVEKVTIAGDWRYDRESNTVFSARVDTHDATYTATSIEPNPSAADLERVDYADPNALADYLSVPNDTPADVIRLAATIVKGARTPFDRALAIQRYLTSPAFLYDTNVPPSDSNDALEQFLLVTKRGFCQQFAAAMAVLARIDRLPSRVAVGFTHGQRQSDGSWLVTTHDAHAWPELYFGGYGWLAFEPTPRGDGQAVEPPFTLTQLPTSPDTGPGNGPTPTPTATPGLAAADRKGLDSLGANAAPAPVVTKSRSSSTPLLALALLAVVVLALPSPALARRITARRRWRRGTTATAQAHAAWEELRASALDAGATWQDGLSPRASARLLRADAGELPAAAAAALDRLVAFVERARYAPAPPQSPVGGLRADARAVRAGLLSRRSRAERILAVVAPRSTLLSARAFGARVADVLDAADLLGARARTALARRSRRLAHPVSG